MGYSWALEGRVRIKPASLAAYRKATIDPSRFEWPESWGEPNASDAMSVDEVVRVLENADAHEIAWNDSGATFAALFSNDSELWLDFRSHLLGLALAAAEVGGEAEIAVTGFIDGGPSDVYRAVAKKDAHEIDVLTAREARPVAKKIHATVEPLLQALVASITPKIAWSIPAELRPLHTRVCAALRAEDPVKVVAAVAQTKTYVSEGKRYDVIERVFPKAPALLDAIERGWENMNVLHTLALAPLALRVLAALDPSAARALAADVRKLKAVGPSRNFIAPYVAQARALAKDVTTEKDCLAALATMKKTLPKAPNYQHHTRLEREPAVRHLRENPSPALRAVTKKALVALAGKPKNLAPADDVYAYALSLVLETCAEKEDRPLLFRLWTDSKGFELLDHARVIRMGDDGAAYMASLFGRDTKTHYAKSEQGLACEALVARDPKRAIAIATKLVAKKKRAEPHEWALQMIFERLGAGKPEKAWVPVMKKACAEVSASGLAALGTLAVWKEKGMAKRVVERLEEGHYDIDQACNFLEAAKDASARAPLERYVAKLGKNDKRAANRARQCLSALARARS